MTTVQTAQPDTEPAPAKIAYSIKEACQRVGIGRSSAYAEIKAGRLKIVKCGRRTLIRVADLDAWLANLTSASS